MFEPDGRNSIQTVGHSLAVGLRWICWVVGAFAVAPTFIYFYSKAQMEFQERTIDAYNRFMPMQAVLVDFGTPDLTGLDRIMREGMGVNLPGRASIKFTTLPFTVTRLQADPKDPEQVWRPIPAERRGMFGPRSDESLVANGNAWVWERLPYAEDQHGWIASAHPDMDPWFTEALKARGILQDHPESRQRSDFWILTGALKLTPTRWWDTQSGEEQLFAKASYNYRAYVVAARATAVMRSLAAARKSGGYLGPEVLLLITVPGDVIRRARGMMDNFEHHYRTVFTGKLPKVVMHLQGFDGELLMKTPRLERFEGDADYMVNRRGGLWPFVTGMYLDDGSLKPRPKSWGRPEWSRWDFLVRSTPVLNAQAVEAQEVLLKLSSSAFWKPLFAAEGLTDADTLQTVEDTLALLRKEIDADTRWSRRWNYRNYYHVGARFEL